MYLQELLRLLLLARTARLLLTVVLMMAGPVQPRGWYESSTVFLGVEPGNSVEAVSFWV